MLTESKKIAKSGDRIVLFELNRRDSAIAADLRRVNRSITDRKGLDVRVLAQPWRSGFLLWVAIVFVFALLLSSCSGASESTLQTHFYSSGVQPQPNQVRLTSSSASGDTLTVFVKITGPTASSDLSAFSFDLLLSDPTVAMYVDGSAVAGSALDPDGSRQIDVQVVHDVQRVSVAIGDRVPSGGTGVGAEEATVVSLKFRVLKGGTSALQFAPQPDPQALDPAGLPVSTVRFDMAPSAIVRD